MVSITVSFSGLLSRLEIAAAVSVFSKMVFLAVNFTAVCDPHLGAMRTSLRSSRKAVKLRIHPHRLDKLQRLFRCVRVEVKLALPTFVRCGKMQFELILGYVEWEDFKRSNLSRDCLSG